MNRRILCLTDMELFAYQVKGHFLLETQRFTPGETGVVQFADYLRRDRKTPLYWLIDSTQEEYQINALPHVSIRDRRHLFALRMRRLFEYTSYTYATVQGREQQGRGDDHVLFTAVHNPSLLQPWIDLILEHKVPLVGIYSLPLLSQNLLKHLVTSPYTLLVNHTPQITANSQCGLRQSFFINQKLQMSRLIPLNTDNSAEYARYVLDQIIKTQRYLENARLFPSAHGILSIFILTTPPFASLFNAFLEKTSVPNHLRIRLIDIRELSQNLGLRTDLTDLFLHHLVAYQLGQRWWIGNHYARLQETRYFLFRQLRVVIYLLSVLLLAGATAVASVDFNHSLEIKQRSSELEKRMILRQTELKQLRLAQLRGEVPLLPLDILYIRNIADVGLYLKARHLSPKPLWIEVSQILNRFPDLKLNQLEWGVGNTIAEIFQKPSNDTESQAELHPAYENTKDTPSDESLTAFYEGLRVSGELISLENDTAQNSQVYQLFITELRKKSGWKIQETVIPGNINLLGVIEGQIGQLTKSVNTPFTTEIFITHEYDLNPH